MAPCQELYQCYHQDVDLEQRWYYNFRWCRNERGKLQHTKNTKLSYLVLPPISFPLWSVSARLTIPRLPDDGWHATLGIVNSGRNNQK